MDKFLNVISFDVPYPANYGGVIDVFYKLKALKKANIKVILHCFEYGRNEQAELNKYVEEIYYYKRKKNILHLFSELPYIVKSRISEELKKNLLKNNYPILFEGLHTCYLLGDENFKNRKKIYRESNIEHEYYRHLASAEKNKIKKKYFLSEAKKLERFEKTLNHANKMFIVSEEETKYFKIQFPNSELKFIPSFHENENITTKPGSGIFLLYHGKLSVPENELAAEFLIKHVFSRLKYKVKIAGMDPSKNTLRLAASVPNIEVIANPDEKEMKNLISEAHIHCLYTHQNTGLKLKLLNVLFQGRHVLVNRNMSHGTTLGPACHYAEQPQEWIHAIEKLMKTEFTKEEIVNRRKILEDYSNKNQITKLINEIWG